MGDRKSGFARCESRIKKSKCPFSIASHCFSSGFVRSYSLSAERINLTSWLEILIIAHILIGTSILNVTSIVAGDGCGLSKSDQYIDSSTSVIYTYEATLEP